jgi:hypothetical protein
MVWHPDRSLLKMLNVYLMLNGTDELTGIERTNMESGRYSDCPLKPIYFSVV